MFLKSSNIFRILSVGGSISISIILSSCGLILPNSRMTTTQSKSNSTITSSIIAGNSNLVGGPAILGFSPASGKLSSMPTTVQVIFSESTMNLDTIQNLANWSFSCSGQAKATPTAVTFTNTVATLTLPTLIQSSSSGSCTLKATTTITNSSGKSLTGVTSATYQVGTDTSSSILKFSSLRPGDRIFGTVPLNLATFSTGPNSPKLSSVYFYLDNVGLGTASQHYDGTYSISLQTNLFQNGPHTIKVSAISTNQVESANAASLNVNIQNINSYSTLPSAGGTGGSPFGLQAPTGMVLFGMRVGYNGSNGNYISNIMPIWRNSYGTSQAMVYGGAYFGGTAGSPNYMDLTCPEPSEGGSSYAVSGLTGKAGTRVESLGVVCRQQYDSSNPVTSTIVGGTAGNTFKNECPTNTFVTVLSGRAGTTAVDQIQGYCN